MRLIDFADEIEPDSCRLWDIDTGKRLDKDVCVPPPTSAKPRRCRYLRWRPSWA